MVAGFSGDLSGSAAVIESLGLSLAEVTPGEFVANNTWMLVATCLVFIMHLGFACLESGLTRAKNTVNILFKNVGIVAIGLLTYAAMGFNLMYPGEFNALAFGDGGVLGFAGFGLEPPENGMMPEYADGGYTYWSDFIFQAMFAATAATIVSGAVAERVKLGPFLVFSAIYVSLVYPVVGSWEWGGGWLDSFGGEGTPGFHDFAGSTLVHSVGGWGALAGVIVLGPRLNKYFKTATGKTEVRPIMGHSMPLAAVGVFLLWFGWFGFNGGSVLSADPEGVSFVFVTTSLAAAAGIVAAMITSAFVQKTPDLTMVLNGALAGLVGITAGADVVGVMDSIIIGLVSGVIVVLSVIGLDRMKLDDPVGAISVHLVCGIWGTLAVGIFGVGFDEAGNAVPKDFVAQLVGVLAVGGFCFPAAMVLMLALKHTVGFRVSREDELRGLDISEHGMESYTGFQIFSTQ